ncbi:MAG TPA: helix-turn-helix domain-containing protein [Pirellulales bacterium]|nr:helix-turn-helix domain-containing protein [Pirellulales bacterium]
MVRKFYETDEAAKVLGITPEQLNEMRDRREVYAVRDGGAWKFKVEEIDRLVAERAEGMLPSDSGEYDDLDDPDSILVSDVGLAPSNAGASSTVIGKSNAPSSPASDIHIVHGESGESDLNLDLPLGSDVRLDPHAVTPGPSSGLPLSGLSSKFDDLDTLDLDMPSAAESGVSIDSDVLPADADLVLPDDPVSLSDKPVTAKPPSDGGGSVLELGDEDDVLGIGSSGIDSDVTRSVTDSGISLVDPSDSGLSLERNDLQTMAGSKKVESLDLGGDDLITLDDEPDLSEATTQLKADDDFLLTPAEEPPIEESSGSQVIALDSELDFDESSTTMLGHGEGVTAMEEEEDEFSESEPAMVGLSSGDLGPAGLGTLPPTSAIAPAPTIAAVATAGDMTFALWNILLLVPLCICLILCGMMMFDLLRNMWSWNGAYPVNSSLMDMILSWFENK